ncbi:MAG: EamA family transporter, partial [Phormidesmis sp.]
VEMMMSPRLLGAIALTSFFATYLGIWLQQVALKYTATGIAQALLATSPLFVLPMAALLGERLSWRTVGGVVIALAGVCLLLSSS